VAKFLVTGAAGFIGFHVSRQLVSRGDAVLGIDNLNDYYRVSLKHARLAELATEAAFTFRQLDVADRTAMGELFAAEPFDVVIHLAAQAGVRYSLQHPAAYVDSNLVGFANVLEGCRHSSVGHLVYASSSSVYGANTKLPFAIEDPVDHPLSLYAATKKANELMAHAYSHLYGLPTTGLRFFTVYGPWGRPDMALWLFVEAIVNDRPINVFNHGRMRRDFTYIDDIVEGVVRVADRIPQPAPSHPAPSHQDSPGPGTSAAPFRIYNIGNNEPIELLRLIELVETCVGKKARTNLLPMQPGDVLETYADIDALVRDVGFRPSTPIETGLARFVDWYRRYHSAPPA
jgi:UDP-glucuronate 4-epimerase